MKAQASRRMTSSLSLTATASPSSLSQDRDSSPSPSPSPRAWASPATRSRTTRIISAHPLQPRRLTCPRLTISGSHVLSPPRTWHMRCPRLRRRPSPTSRRTVAWTRRKPPACWACWAKLSCHQPLTPILWTAWTTTHRMSEVRSPSVPSWSETACVRRSSRRACLTLAG